MLRYPVRLDAGPGEGVQLLVERLMAAACDMRRALVAGYNSDTVFAPHDLLLDAHPDQVRTLMHWALTHREELKEWPPDPGIQRYVVATLGRVGVPATADMLRQYVHHPDLGQAAVAAIKAIETRSDTSP